MGIFLGRVLMLYSFGEARGLVDSNLIYPMWRLYKAMSKAIERNWGELTASSMMELMRKVYSGRTDPLLWIMARVGRGEGFMEAWIQWIADPVSRDIYVSFATLDKYAYENPVHHFNIFDLINAEPP